MSANLVVRQRSQCSIQTILMSPGGSVPILGTKTSQPADLRVMQRGNKNTFGGSLDVTAREAASALPAGSWRVLRLGEHQCQLPSAASQITDLVAVVLPRGLCGSGIQVQLSGALCSVSHRLLPGVGCGCSLTSGLDWGRVCSLGDLG